ncbi:hypothetical protein EDB19DRAFT_16492 [Suillus lakei]|nr:hypothetical protein EDB19DRAFT_16492 [Suillus lakei]
MSDAASIRSTRSAPPSYSVALQHSIQEEEEPPRVPPRVVTEAPLIVLAPPTNSSTETLVQATARNYSANVEAITPSSSDVEARGPFTFSPFGPNAMLLLPHALSSNSRPLYHISVSSDCFRPQIYTTTIRRGTEQGKVIAEIQRSILQDDGYRGTVEYTGSRRPKVAYLDSIHFQRGEREKLRYEWHFDKDIPLLWQTICSGKTVLSVQCTRFGVRNPPILATLHPSNKKGQLQTLDVTSEGRPYMDNIVVSCLATEGRRTTKYDR